MIIFLNIGQDSCGSNFRCSNSSNMCIMSQAHCDGIWDCENGTDEENCGKLFYQNTFSVFHYFVLPKKSIIC